jgi:hypothetical protein
MQIQLSQNEIKDAIRKYVGTDLGINLVGKTLGVAFTATRGETGVIATLNIEVVKDNVIGAGVSTVIPGYTDRPAGSDNGLQLVGANAGNQAQTQDANTGATSTTTEASTTQSADTDNSATVIEETKSVPEEVAQAAEASAEILTSGDGTPAPEPVAETAAAASASTTTTSLFGG